MLNPSFGSIGYDIYHTTCKGLVDHFGHTFIQFFNHLLYFMRNIGETEGTQETGTEQGVVPVKDENCGLE